ncbi:MAG: flagellar protein [Lachnospiraceae bacterium]|jgi:flagellar operon protein (TIGR03826 family)|nr:flagellar protein [Lachnospiraceae bacterium]
MNVKNCRMCGRLFNYVAGPFVCPSCKEEVEKKFQEVKKYIQEHPGATVPQVADECDVEQQQIRDWVREERLEFAEGSGVGIFCEHCGAAIQTGRYCAKCKAEMTNSMNSILNANKPKPVERKKDPKDNPKMRFLG